MSLIPEFELGLLNAWIFNVYIIAYNLMPYILSNEKENLKKIGHADFKLEKSQKRLGNYITIVFFIPIIYSIFLPMKLNTIWFYIGLIVYLFGIILATDAMYYFLKTPSDILITNGIYRYSRNPIYLGIILIFIGTAIASFSFVYLILTILFAFFINRLVLIEEKYCLIKYKNEFEKYMKKTSRWI